MSLFGLGSKKDKSWIDGQTSGAQWGALNQFQQTPSTYTPTSQAQVQSYFNPYQDTAIKGALGDLNYQNQLALNNVGDNAVGQHAFGGSRQGVAQALTNDAFARQGGLLASQMQSQGYWNALNAAQQENALQYQYPLTRQQVYNQTVGGITPMKFGKSQDPGRALDNFGGLLNAGGNIASFFGG